VDYEVILIDDGSTDDTLNIVKAKYGGLEQVEIFTQSNVGLSATRNKGVGIAKKDFVMFLDSDDLIDSGKLSKLINRAHTSKIDLLLFSGVAFNKEATQPVNYHVDYTRPPELSTKVFTGPVLLNKLLKTNYFCSACMYFYRRELVKNLRFENIIYEDNLFTYKLMSLCSIERAAVSSDIIYYRRVRENSIMTSPMKLANVISYKYILNTFIMMAKLDNGKVQKENLQLLISNLHVSLVNTIFKLENTQLLMKIKMWLATLPVLYRGKYSLSNIAKCTLPFLVIFKRRLNK